MPFRGEASGKHADVFMAFASKSGCCGYGLPGRVTSAEREALDCLPVPRRHAWAGDIIEPVHGRVTPVIEPTIIYLDAHKMSVFYDSDRMKFFGQDDDRTTVIIHFNPVDAAKLIRSLGEYLEVTNAE
jgi:hypothetical protein